MPRTGPKNNRRKHLIIVLIALAIALIVLLIRAETASASNEPATLQTIPAEQTQMIGDDYQRALTTERLMILGMLGLVVLTWFYLKWRPAPGYREDKKQDDQHPERED